MPEYTALALVALGLAAGAAVAVGLHRDRAAWLTVGVFSAATVVFDVLLTAIPVVTYSQGDRSGIGIGPMPVEDLAYGIALCLTALVTWTLAGRSRRWS